jgi:hypothetical protein
VRCSLISEPSATSSTNPGRASPAASGNVPGERRARGPIRRRDGKTIAGISPSGTSGRPKRDRGVARTRSAAATCRPRRGDPSTRATGRGPSRSPRAGRQAWNTGRRLRRKSPPSQNVPGEPSRITGSGLAPAQLPPRRWMSSLTYARSGAAPSDVPSAPCVLAVVVDGPCRTSRDRLDRPPRARGRSRRERSGPGRRWPRAPPICSYSRTVSIRRRARCSAIEAAANSLQAVGARRPLKTPRGLSRRSRATLAPRVSAGVESKRQARVERPQ